MIEYYTIKEIAQLLSISYDAVRMRIQRGVYPPFRYNARVIGTTKKAFWALCVKQEKIGLIRAKDMPQMYRQERLTHVGAVSYEDNVLYGRSGA